MVTEKKKVCITGSAGQTGRHILKALSKYSDQLDVCACIHEKERTVQENTVKSICPHACPCSVDADDLDALVESFKGVSDLFIVPSASEAKVRQTFNYIRAAKKANVPFVAVLSMSGAERRNYLWADQFWSIEEEVKRSGLPNWCILRSAFYMQNLLLYAEQYAEGRVPLPIGPDAKFAPIDVHDVGEAAAVILKDCKPHKNKTYTVTGPEAVTAKDITSVLSQFMQQELQMNKKLEWADISLNDAKQILLSAGVPPGEVQGLAEFYRTVRDTGPDFESVTDDFKNLTGHEATSMKDWLHRVQDHLVALMKQSSGGKQSQVQQSESQTTQPAASSSQVA